MSAAFSRSLLIWAGLLAVLIWPISLKFADPVAIPQSAQPVPVGEITRGVTVRQQLPPPGTALSSVALFLDTYQHTSARVLEIAIEIRDRDGHWITISHTSVALSRITDKAYYTLSFSPPLRIPPTKNLAIALSSDAPPGEAVTWLTAPAWTNTEFQLSTNDRVQQGNAIMTAAYVGERGPLLKMLPAIWQRITVFLEPPWQLLLLLALIVALGAAGVVILRR